MKLFAATCLALLVSFGAANAEMAKKPDPAPAADTKAPKARTPRSIECSKQADAKGLKGKERQKFRNKCKHEKS